MKNIYVTLALLFFVFTSCKNNEGTNENQTAIDSTAISQDGAPAADTVMTVTDTTSLETDSSGVATDSKSDVKLPNKISTTEKVIPGEKGKYALAETKWGLIELNGKAIENKGREYFINFDSKSGTFRSFVGCNRFTGKYFMKSEGKLGFSNIISTRKACDNMDVERNFFNNLQKVDNYMIENGGKILHLHTGKKAVAKFEAIR
ncbi:META domain-containing protein [Flavobacterium sp.]